MNREIKFRAWDKKYKSMLYWDIDLHCRYDYEHSILEYFNDPNLTMLQFTGLTDVNGVEIFEGDIVKLHSKWEDITTPFSTYEVQINNVLSISFILKSTHDDFYKNEIGCDADLGEWVFKYLEVIGNIFENSDLL